MGDAVVSHRYGGVHPSAIQNSDLCRRSRRGVAADDVYQQKSVHPDVRILSPYCPRDRSPGADVCERWRTEGRYEEERFRIRPSSTRSPSSSSTVNVPISGVLSVDYSSYLGTGIVLYDGLGGADGWLNW